MTDTRRNEGSETESDPSQSPRLRERTWQDVERYLDQHEPVAIVPIGSTEQHGPHLPLGVDAYQAEDLAVAIADEADALAAPPIHYGDANHHLEFPGTISLTTETVVDVLEDVYDSLVGHGFRNIITVNGHRVANLKAIETAAQHATERHEDAIFATIDPLRFGVSVHTELRDGDPEDGMHGGEFETSFIQYLHPDLVREEKFERETAEGFSRFQSNNLIGRDDAVLTPSTAHSPAEGHLGHVGDPTKAGSEKGKELYNRIVEDGAEFVAELRNNRVETDEDTRE